MNFPNEIKKLIGSHEIEPVTVGMSAADVWRCGELYIKRTPFDASPNPKYSPDSVKRGHMDELKALIWLQGKLKVPELIEHVETPNEGWFVTRFLEGASLIDIEKDENTVLRVLAEGLEEMAAVDVTDCPLDGFGARSLEVARENAMRMTGFPEDKEDWNDFESPIVLWEWLKAHQPKIESPTLIHGDYCLPNVFCKDGHFSGVLDLGWCGVGDKWIDIALAGRSLGYNRIGDQNLTPKLCKMAGLTPDEDMLRYYILLDELF